MAGLDDPDGPLPGRTAPVAEGRHVEGASAVDPAARDTALRRLEDTRAVPRHGPSPHAGQGRKPSKVIWSTWRAIRAASCAERTVHAMTGRLRRAIVTAGWGRARA